MILFRVIAFNHIIHTWLLFKVSVVTLLFHLTRYLLAILESMEGKCSFFSSELSFVSPDHF